MGARLPESVRRTDVLETGIAVVGMAVLLPGAPDLDAFRANLEAGVDALGDVPPERWDPAVFLDPSSDRLDRFYGTRGGFVDRHARFDPLAFGVVPHTVDEAEPDQLVVLKLCADALADAGYAAADLPQETTGVILGRGGYLNAGLARSAQRVREGEQVVSVLRQVLPHLPQADLDRVQAAFREAAGPLPADQAIGLVPNLVASRTANRLDLRGPAYTVDAACASSLLAIDHAVGMLRRGTLDAALVGGVHLCHDPVFWSIFCRLGAMSRSGRIRPFDTAADGLLIGEGAGVVLLKRLSDARRDGDRVYAVVRGTGVASDGRGGTLMAPGSAGQVLAVRRAWADAGLDPATVGLVEAHGTATAAGDAAELATLREVFGPDDGRPRAGLGSVKSMIGHAMPAAGIAGFVKAALSVHHKRRYPTLGVTEPHPALADSRFALTTEAEPWPTDGGPVRAGVNAFGFGGIDAHVVLDAAPPSHVPLRPAVRLPREPIALYAAPTLDDLVERVEADDRGGEGPCRLALADPTPARRTRAAKLVARGKPVSGRRGTWFRPRGLAMDGGRVALLFPGVEAAFDADVQPLADALGLTVPPVLAQRAAGLDDLGLRGAQILGAGRVLRDALGACGVRADVVAGHSVGEWTALAVAGRIDESALDGFIDGLGGETLEVPDVAFGALGASVEQAAPWLAAAPDVVVSHDNCPHQTIVCGPPEQVQRVVDLARGPAEILPFKSGFHTPHFAPFVDRFRPHVLRLPLGEPTIPVWSATTVAPWPDDEPGVRQLLLDLLTHPVRFRRVVERLYAEGVRVFVQCGTGSLPGFVGDTLRGRDHLAVAAADPKRPVLDQVARTVAALWVEGVDVDTRPLTALRDGRGRALRLGTPLVQLEAPPTFAGTADDLDDTVPDGALGDAVRAAFSAVKQAQRDVVDALRPPNPAASAPVLLDRTTRVGLDTHPFLADHALFAQPEGAPPVTTYPVIPMTMLVQWMIDAATEVAGDRVVVGLDEVVALRWTVVEPAADLRTVVERLDDDRLSVSVEGYAQATAVLADTWPAPPPVDDRPFTAPRPTPVDAVALYADKWMFHGPAYRAVTDLGPMGDDGIRGVVEATSVPGALLDNAGQVHGYWGFASLPVDSLGFPARIARVRFTGPFPEDGTPVTVTSRITRVTGETFGGDLQLVVDGRVWCTLDGWTNRRFETDDVVLPLLRAPSTHGLATRDANGLFWTRERWRTSAARELLMRRYLDPPRLARWEAVPPWERRDFVLRRIAVADAVRAWLWDRGHGPVFPLEVQVDDAPDGTYIAHGPTGPLHVSLAVTTGLAVARVSPDGPRPVALAPADDPDDGFVAHAP